MERPVLFCLLSFTFIVTFLDGFELATICCRFRKAHPMDTFVDIAMLLVVNIPLKPSSQSAELARPKEHVKDILILFSKIGMFFYTDD
jgi:hypothetical protein